MVKILVQRPTLISAVATVLLITNTFTVKYYERERKRERDGRTDGLRDRQTERQTTETDRHRDRDRQTERESCMLLSIQCNAI